MQARPAAPSTATECQGRWAPETLSRCRGVDGHAAQLLMHILAARCCLYDTVDAVVEGDIHERQGRERNETLENGPQQTAYFVVGKT